MERVTNSEELSQVKNNKIITGENVSFLQTEIIFEGENNLLFLDKNIILKNTKIIFKGNNSIVFLSENKHAYLLNVTLYHNSTLFIGKNNYFNNPLNCILSEEKNVIIGNDGLYSFNIWMRTADPHLIYDATTNKRLNYSKSIYIGDHVWVGQNAFCLKGTKIGSGTILGAMAVTSKTLLSNCSYAGNPAKLVKKNISWNEKCVHAWTKKMTDKHKTASTTLYKNNKKEDYFTYIEENLQKLATADNKLTFLQNELYNAKDKNRFAITKIKKKASICHKILNKMKHICKK